MNIFTGAHWNYKLNEMHEKDANGAQSMYRYIYLHI